ncbi:hypothetical protein DS834_00540 [Lactobacillus bombicola]|uniref:S-layer protein C-terminal domain-containing protein n=1 Tax=Lactobacillus bombicola TaxID=1505723 RepID=A0ABX9LWG2_9LACO|nr:SLAP domain-containing protein [Lactobacillus bombicola]RHW53459.1 hypothetical protein DS834_00540 [Lactobacillus bombicola]
MIISVAGAALLSVGVTEGTTAANNVSAATVKSAKKVVAKTKVVGATSAVYKKAGKKVVKTKQTISAGKKVKTYGKKTIAGVAYYSIGKDQYVKAANLDGKTRQLAKSVALYTRSGKVIKHSKLRKGQSVKVYGTAVTIKGKKYYSTGKGYVAVKALAKKVAEEVPNNKANKPATDTNKPAENTNNSSSNNTNTNNSSSSSNTGAGNTTPVDILKDAANAAIDRVAVAANAAINKLTDENDKAIRKELVADAVKSAKKAIDSASNAALIESLKNTWTDTIQNLVTVSDAFKEQRTIAHNLISDVKESVLKVADKLDDNKKQVAKDAINNAFTSAITAIDKATKPAEIKSARESFFSAIDKAIPVADLQTAAIDEIKAKVNVANGAIDNSQASDIDKTDRKNLIIKLGSSAEKSIKASSNVALIENAKNTWLKAIDNLVATDNTGKLVVPNELQNKKDSIKSNIKSIFSIINGAINKNVDPTGSLSLGLNGAQQVANLAIDKASKLSDIENAQSIFCETVNTLMNTFDFKDKVVDKVKTDSTTSVDHLNTTALSKLTSDEDKTYKDQIVNKIKDIQTNVNTDLKSAKGVSDIAAVNNKATLLISIEQRKVNVITRINRYAKANTTGDANKIKQTAAEFKSKVMNAQSHSELKALQASAEADIKAITPSK